MIWLKILLVTYLLPHVTTYLIHVKRFVLMKTDDSGFEGFPLMWKTEPFFPFQSIAARFNEKQEFFDRHN